MLKFPSAPGTLVATGVHWLNGSVRFVPISTRYVRLDNPPVPLSTRFVPDKLRPEMPSDCTGETVMSSKPKYAVSFRYPNCRTEMPEVEVTASWMLVQPVTGRFVISRRMAPFQET